MKSNEIKLALHNAYGNSSFHAKGAAIAKQALDKIAALEAEAVQVELPKCPKCGTDKGYTFRECTNCGTHFGFAVEPVCTTPQQATPDTELIAALPRCNYYLADLNGSAWIKGNDVGAADMRQRAKALQVVAWGALEKAKS